jgi:hypothetical protein
MKPNNDNPLQFYSYMEQLAVNHKKIKHSENNKHYFRGELEEFYLGYRNEVKFPALIVEGYELGHEKANKIWKNREFSFIVAQDYNEKNAYDQIDVANNICETITEDIIRRIIYDIDENNLNYSFEYGAGFQIENVDKRYLGIRYTAVLKSCFNDNVDKTQWIDL